MGSGAGPRYCFAMRLRASLALLAVLAPPLAAQDRIPSHCIALSEAPARVMTASFRDPVAADAVRITFVDHAMFLIQAGDVAAATDFTGFLGNVDFLPDVVTMNNAHGTHWTRAPDPAIPHVLQGWPQDGARADHYLDLGDMLIRNVTTDRRLGGGGMLPDGNSIFVFEAAGLCIAHLGHLHQPLGDAQVARLGRMDVVMVPVDGGLTLDLPTMLSVIDRLQARIVIPMHWFGRGTLEAFVAEMSDDFAIDRRPGNSVTLTLADLPDRPTVLLLEPAFLAD